MAELRAMRQALRDANSAGDEFDRALVDVQLFVVQHPEVSLGCQVQLRSRSSKLAEPHQCTGQVDEAQVVATGLFVAGGQPSAALEAVK